MIKGNSGCMLSIIDNNIIRKSCEPEYNYRLANQKEKQKRYVCNIFEAPKIFGDGYEDNRYYFDMKYYNYNNFIDYFMMTGVEDASILVEKIVGLVGYYDRTSEYKMVKYTDIKNKVLLIYKKTKYNYIMDLFNVFPKESIYIKVGNCHGDLTLSNMLFSNRKYVLIDFLDSFIETPIQDMVKLRQDTKYLWSFNLYNGVFDKIRLTNIMEYIDNHIDYYFRGFDYYLEYYKLFQYLNLIRILPYAKEDWQKDWVYNNVKELMNV
jgi:hypothetical protein